MEISQIEIVLQPFPPVLLLQFYGADRNYRQTSKFNSRLLLLTCPQYFDSSHCEQVVCFQNLQALHVYPAGTEH